MSNTQFHKTCFATILLNRDIYHYVKYGVLPSPPKIKRIDTPLAIEMKNLIDFDEDLIPVKSKPVPTPQPKTKQDLIPVKSKPVPTPQPKTKQDLIPVKSKPVPAPQAKTQNKIDQIIEKNLSDFAKDPYKKVYLKSKFEKNKK